MIEYVIRAFGHLDETESPVSYQMIINGERFVTTPENFDIALSLLKNE